jgi:hypothetical protein
MNGAKFPIASLNIAKHNSYVPEVRNTSEFEPRLNVKLRIFADRSRTVSAAKRISPEIRPKEKPAHCKRRWGGFTTSTIAVAPANCCFAARRISLVVIFLLEFFIE